MDNLYSIFCRLDETKGQLKQAVGIVDLLRVVTGEAGRETAAREGISDDSIQQALWNVELLLGDVLKRLSEVEAGLSANPHQENGGTSL